jgi:hypothetical protein
VGSGGDRASFQREGGKWSEISPGETCAILQTHWKLVFTLSAVWNIFNNAVKINLKQVHDRNPLFLALPQTGASLLLFSGFKNSIGRQSRALHRRKLTKRPQKQ